MAVAAAASALAGASGLQPGPQAGELSELEGAGRRRGATLIYPSRDVYANNPNSYINHIRDNGFVERYDVDRRDPSYYRYRASPLGRQARATTPTAMTVAAADAVVAPGQLLQRQGHLSGPPMHRRPAT